MRFHILCFFFFSYVACSGAIKFPNWFSTATSDIYAEAKYAEGFVHDTATQFKEFWASLDDVITSAQSLRRDVEANISVRNLRRDPEAIANEHDLTLEDIPVRLSKELSVVLENIKAEFSEPPPKDQDEHYKHRAQKISRALLQVRDAFIRVSSLWGMSEQDAKIWFDGFEPQLSKVLNIFGLLMERHPDITRAIFVSAVAIIIFEAWILRPIFNLFGFGRVGPVKGSLAAAAQRFFWNGAVKKGSWFSWFQSAAAKL